MVKTVSYAITNMWYQKHLMKVCKWISKYGYAYYNVLLTITLAWRGVTLVCLFVWITVCNKFSSNISKQLSISGACNLTLLTFTEPGVKPTILLVISLHSA